MSKLRKRDPLLTLIDVLRVTLAVLTVVLCLGSIIVAFWLAGVA